jgi:hypothetical protein
MTAQQALPQPLCGTLGRASEHLSVPVHISFSTVRERVAGGFTLETALSLLCQSYHADSVTAYLGLGPYMGQPTGVARDSPALTQLRTLQDKSDGRFQLRFVPNEGPYTKLLSQLKRFWGQNVLLVTADDDKTYPPEWLNEIARGYHKSRGRAIIAPRVHPIDGDVCAGGFLYSLRNVRNGSSGVRLLPTGVAGVGYRPRFFHPILFNHSFRANAATADDIGFRFATLLRGVPVIAVARSNRIGDDGERPKLKSTLQAFNNGRARLPERGPQQSRNTQAMRQMARWLHGAGYGAALDAGLRCDGATVPCELKREGGIGTGDYCGGDTLRATRHTTGRFNRSVSTARSGHLAATSTPAKQAAFRSRHLDHRDALHESLEAANAEVSELREALGKARAREDALQMVIDRWMGERTAHGAAGPSREGG